MLRSDIVYCSIIVLHLLLAVRCYKRDWHLGATFNLSCVSFLIYVLYLRGRLV